MKRMTLMAYIEMHHDGNISQFARSIGTSRRQVYNFIEQQCYVEDGEIKRTVYKIMEQCSDQ